MLGRLQRLVERTVIPRSLFWRSLLIVVVPLLILLARFTERPAMATSLAAIGIIAVVGTISYAIRGDVHYGYGLLLGLPAAVGAFGGTALQQRVRGPLLSYGFAALLAAIGIWLLV